MQVSQQKKVQHLYWRAGFGLNPMQWKANKNQSISILTKKLIRDAKTAKPLTTSFEYSEEQVKQMSKQQRVELRQAAKREVATVNLQWLLRMGNPGKQSLLEKMTLFWHGHFACELKRPDFAVDYLNVIRKHSLGNFKDLVLGIARTPAMIRYLNNQQNRKRQPNENFARELMELFTIGRGNYSENDIKEAARAFTGWTSNHDGFLFKEQWHDYGEKSFMGISGYLDGENIINHLLKQKETAVFITRKIYRFFVNEIVDESRVNQLANSFYDNGYAIDKLIDSIFTSEWFYEDKNMGNKIKSPIEFIAGLINQLDAKFESPQPLFGIQKALGQTLLNPPNVAGWKGGRAWIDNATLLMRLNVGRQFLTQAEMNVVVKEAFEAKATNKRLKNVRMSCDLNALESIVGDIENIEKIADYIIQPSIGNKAELLQRELTAAPNNELFKYQIIGLMSLPEYQLC